MVSRLTSRTRSCHGPRVRFGGTSGQESHPKKLGILAPLRDTAMGELHSEVLLLSAYALPPKTYRTIKARMVQGSSQLSTPMPCLAQHLDPWKYLTDFLWFRAHGLISAPSMGKEHGS